MSHDEEIARRLLVELNHGAICIPGDDGLVILSSDSEEVVTEEEEDTEEEEVKDEPVGSGSPSRRLVAPISSASSLKSLVTIGGGAFSSYLRLGS
ncbi:unnamed protein product [Miscanthus lutarioriparius]|uniref:Uncharacterized protein n=1 Tax=Miscanthus lutarioriparius TaxID=422564 RepID=A0A811RYZ8_9POAL|nr:unnamed protein product [Miscanthus lutarioriparius]